MATTPSHLTPTVVSEAAPSTLIQAEPRLRLVPRRVWLPRAVEAPAACGWYDSSRELRQGLAVREWDAEEAPIPLEWFGLPGRGLYSAGLPATDGRSAQRGGAL